MSDFTSASDLGQQKRLKKEYEKTPIVFCKACGSEAGLSAA